MGRQSSIKMSKEEMENYILGVLKKEPGVYHKSREFAESIGGNMQTIKTYISKTMKAKYPQIVSAHTNGYAWIEETKVEPSEVAETKPVEDPKKTERYLDPKKNDEGYKDKADD